MLKKIAESLKRKYGPLPLWAWTAIAGAAVFLWNRRRGGPTEAASSEPAFAPAYGFGEGEADYGDTGGGVDGAVSAPVMPGGDVDYFPDNKLRMEAMELIDQIRGIQDELGSTAYAPPADGSEDVVTPDVPASVATAGAGAATGVKWGGQTFKTKAGLASWLQQHGGGSPAAAFKTWAKRHPGAAKKLSGPAPKPKAKPQAKAAKTASSRTPARAPAKAGSGAGGARARSAQPPASQPARPRPEPARQSPKPAPKVKVQPPRKPSPAPRSKRGRSRKGGV